MVRPNIWYVGLLILGALSGCDFVPTIIFRTKSESLDSSFTRAERVLAGVGLVQGSYKLKDGTAVSRLGENGVVNARFSINDIPDVFAHLRGRTSSSILEIDFEEFRLGQLKFSPLPEKKFIELHNALAKEFGPDICISYGRLLSMPKILIGPTVMECQ